MKTSDFKYNLPQELIAQVPLDDRSSSKLLVMDKHSGKIQHRIFRDITEFLNPGDCLVLNNTRVLPARLIGEKEKTGGKIPGNRAPGQLCGIFQRGRGDNCLRKR